MLWGCPPRQRRMVARQSRFVEEPVLVARVQTHARGGFVATKRRVHLLSGCVFDDGNEMRSIASYPQVKVFLAESLRCHQF